MPTGQNRCGFLLKIDDKYHTDYCLDYDNCQICRNNDRCQCIYCSNPDSATCFELRQFELIDDLEQLAYVYLLPINFDILIDDEIIS